MQDHPGTRVTVSRGLEAANGESIRRLEEGDKVRYTNVMLLGPGEWTDAASRTTLFYAPDAIKRSAENWIDPRTGESVEKAPLNHYHEHDVPAENVGHIDVDSAHADGQGHLYADIVFHMRTQRSREMEEMMKLSMEEDGQEGLGGISVEIPDDETEWDGDRQMERMKQMWFSGAGLVMNPASATVDFAEQSKRVTALAAAEDDRTFYTLSDGETTKRGQDGQGDMGDDNDPFDRLRTLRDRADEMSRELQDPTDMALDAVGTYLTAEENAREDDLSAFQAWAAEALEDAVLSAVEEALTEYQSAAPEEAANTVGDFMDWAEGASGEETPEGETPPAEGGEETPEEGMEMQDGGVDQATVEEVADTLESVMETVDMAVSELKSDVGGVEETVEAETQELRQEVSELEARLEQYEGEGQTRSLAGGDPDAGGEETPETTAPTPRRTSDGYISQ